MEARMTKHTDMAVVRTHHYTVDPADLPNCWPDARR